MDIGRRVRVFDQVREETEICDRDEKHHVPIYSVKIITVIDKESRLIKALNYTSDGWGDVLIAVDAQGRRYEKSPHWDGPRATVWMRSDRKTFTEYPIKKFSRDLTNRPIKW